MLAVWLQCTGSEDDVLAAPNLHPSSLCHADSDPELSQQIVPGDLQDRSHCQSGEQADQRCAGHQAAWHKSAERATLFSVAGIPVNDGSRSAAALCHATRHSAAGIAAAAQTGLQPTPAHNATVQVRDAASAAMWQMLWCSASDDHVQSTCAPGCSIYRCTMAR